MRAKNRLTAFINVYICRAMGERDDRQRIVRRELSPQRTVVQYEDQGAHRVASAVDALVVLFRSRRHRTRPQRQRLCELGLRRPVRRRRGRRIFPRQHETFDVDFFGEPAASRRG